ncbi:glycosyltransferase family 2 protein [Hydrogenophaga sp. NH-16]|uniref:glycosyltransferase family 2 protein n=1 Tax=Hydrogenophaga sp. NH-16 TaxID=2184519 RepID=UPI000FDB722E|nr:glycosyltransferase family 2 protein [Hydrogenophaga sp. NH-16]
MAEHRKPTLCIGILTLNEAHRIARCIQSASFADQVVVIDSGSEDRTREIAQEMGAQVHLFPDWRGFAEQRNRLMTHVKADWIFFLDADEVIPHGLQDEIRAAVASGENAVWKIYWDQVAFGRTLHRMAKTEGGVWRLFRTDQLLRYEGVVHEHAVLRDPTTPVKTFRTRLLHHSRESVYGGLLKMAQYAQLGAVRRVQAGRRGGVLRGLASATSNFIRLYIFRRGFLCGAEGFLFCLLVALECFFRYAIIRYDRPVPGDTMVKR